jgi:hypothetical protein
MTEKYWLRAVSGGLASQRNPEPARPRPSSTRHASVIVGHPTTLPPEINCPAAFDLEYEGVFYAGNRKLAAFEYAASGCQSIQLSAGSHQASTVIVGKSAAAVPASFTADSAAVLRVRPATVYQDPAGVSGSAPPNT